MSEAVAHSHARGWCRVDLAGGTLDIWPLGLLHPGSRTVNLAIDLAVEAGFRRRSAGYVVRQGASRIEEDSVAALCRQPEGALVGQVLTQLDTGPVEVELLSNSPRGGGLGASSALMIVLIAAGEALLGHEPSSPSARAALARDLEARMMSLPTGVQDHYPAMHGGALEITYAPGGERVRALDVDLAALGECLIVAYTGSSHFSAGANWSVVRRRLDGEAEIVALFERIAEAATEVAEAIEAADFERVGAAMAREWSARSRLSEEVSTPKIETLLNQAAALGAWGGKACGAGGGGSIAVLAPPRNRAAIEAKFAELGAEVLAVQPAQGGVAVTVGDGPLLPVAATAFQ